MTISFFSVDPEYFIECLRVFDRGGNGLVNASELRHVLCNLGDKLTLDEVNQLLVAFEDNTGHVIYEEFVKQVMTGFKKKGVNRGSSFEILRTVKDCIMKSRFIF